MCIISARHSYKIGLHVVGHLAHALSKGETIGITVVIPTSACLTTVITFGQVPNRIGVVTDIYDHIVLGTLGEISLRSVAAGQQEKEKEHQALNHRFAIAAIFAT